ncbi:MAG: GGDEF domain-containing protein [bacterium]
MDGLSAIGNRQHLLNRLGEEIARYNRTKQPFSFLILDIDHYQSLRDRYSHSAVDYIIKVLSQLLPSSLRKYDIVGQYSEAKFGIILPNTNLSLSLQVGERLQSRIENYAFISGQERLPITVSIGLAEASPAVSDSLELINQAFEALQKAREDSRTCVYSSR